MADSDSHLGPGYGSGLAPRTPSVGPSNRTSAEGTRSQDNLLSGSAVDNNSGRELGDSVPDAPSRVEEIVAENPEHATNRRLGTSRDSYSIQLAFILLNGYVLLQGTCCLYNSQFHLNPNSSRLIILPWTISNIGR
jgi:hypothetical protein